MKTCRLIILFCFCYFVHYTFGQVNNRYDSISNYWSSQKNSTKKVYAILDLAAAVADENDFNKSREYISKALLFVHELKDERCEMDVRYEQGRTEYLAASYVHSVDAYLKSLKIAQKYTITDQEVKCNSAIGMVYYALSDFKKSLEYFDASLKETKDTSTIATAYVYKAGIFFNLQQLDSAEALYQKASDLYAAVHSPSDVIMCQENLANLYSKQGKTTKAIDILHNSLLLAQELNDPSQVAYGYFSLACVYADNNLNNKAVENYQIALKKFVAVNDLTYVSNCHLGLSNAYYAMNDSKNALEHYKTYIEIRDSTLNIEQAKEITRKELLFQVEKKQLADSLVQVQKVHELEIVNNAKVKQQQIYAYAGLFGFIMMLILAIVLFRNNRIKQKANEAIAAQKKKVEMQRDVIEEKQKEIIDSLNYARRIQKSLLPTETYIQKNLKRLVKKNNNEQDT